RGCDDMYEQLTRITHNSDVMGGKACIKGTRVTVGMILTLISEGKTIKELLDDYPYLENEDVMQAIAYAAWIVDGREAVIISA
ncbi:MAG: DUF433 domain-containing protein, partial [Oscillospiraceae bacterium]|nr:DUF433 domain-containing protein [Oscillospiraceae bacterium]